MKKSVLALSFALTLAATLTACQSEDESEKEVQENQSTQTVANTDNGNTTVEFDELKKQAESGDSNAQFELGQLYERGKGVNQDDTIAVEWFRKAANQEHEDAQFSLGWMYEQGKGVNQNNTIAVEWYRKAAKNGHEDAQYLLRYMRANDDEDAIQDKQEIVQTENKLENNKTESMGDADAQISRRDSYFRGEDHWNWSAKAAIERYSTAAEQGDMVAQYYLGAVYDKKNDYSSDRAKAREWYLKAANQGHAQAQNNLGYMHENGRVDGGYNYNKAEKWYRKAANQGLAEAQYNLGLMYQAGRSVSRNGKLEFSWLHKAANQGLVEAQIPVGDFYMSGRGGVSKDYTVAKEWYKKACDKGSKNACQRIKIYIESQ